MSCLTKKLFLFMGLSIVCNPTFAADNPGSSQNQSPEDRIAECKANVNLVFPENVTPFSSFKYALFMLSVQVIKDMRNTVQLANFMRQQSEMLISEEPNILEFVRYRIYADLIGNRNVDITPSKKTDINGYFKHLIKNFDLIEESIGVNIKLPAQYCAEEYINVLGCREALKIMLRRKEENFNQMTAYMALRLCFLKYSYSNFFDFSIFVPSSSTSSTYTPPDEELELRINQRDIMKSYFRHLMGQINLISIEVLTRIGAPIFPKVEDYCRDPQ